MVELKQLLEKYMEAERAAIRAEASLRQIDEVSASPQNDRAVKAGELRLAADSLHHQLMQELRAFERRGAK